MAHQHPHPGPGDDDYLASKFRKVGQHLIVELFEKKEFKAFHTLPDGTTEFQIHQWRLDREKEVYNAFIIERLPSGGILQPASEPLSKISRNFAHNGRDMPHWIYREMDSTRARYWRQHNAALRAVGQPLDVSNAVVFPVKFAHHEKHATELCKPVRA